ncbi:MAG: hypothetical protein ACP5HZ_03925 [Ferrimicrobium sp.]
MAHSFHDTVPTMDIAPARYVLGQRDDTRHLSVYWLASKDTVTLGHQANIAG